MEAEAAATSQVLMCKKGKKGEAMLENLEKELKKILADNGVFFEGDLPEGPVLEISSPPYPETILADTLAFLTSRVFLFAKNDEKKQITFPLGENLMALLQLAHEEILPVLGFNTGYNVHFNIRARTLTCWREE